MCVFFFSFFSCTLVVAEFSAMSTCEGKAQPQPEVPFYSFAPVLFPLGRG